jgi:hypothetical protein
MPNTTQLYANQKDLWIKIKHLPSGNSVKFKAMLKSFSDNFESNWNSEEVYGRMDPIETFQGTKRIIQIEWDVVAYDLYEAEDNLYNADRLSTFLYPVYSDLGNSNSITTAPLLRMKFSNLISSVNSEGLLGRLAGFQYTPDLDSGVFFNSNNLMCPQAITINATFHVLHEHSLGWNSAGALREKRLPHGAKRPPPRPPAAASPAAAPEESRHPAWGIVDMLNDFNTSPAGQSVLASAADQVVLRDQGSSDRSAHGFQVTHPKSRGK